MQTGQAQDLSLYQSPRQTSQKKKRQLTTPSCRFPLQMGLVPPARRGNLKEGDNYELWLHDRYYIGSKWQLKWRRNGVCQVMR
jgi:hypothetical protein